MHLSAMAGSFYHPAVRSSTFLLGCLNPHQPLMILVRSCHDFIWDEIPKTEMYPDTVPRPGLRSTLTALLAFGALLDRDTRESEMLYHAARSCYLSVMDGSTLESVHLALQLAVYEMNSRRANSAIHTVAVAIRTAQHLVS